MWGRLYQFLVAFIYNFDTLNSSFSEVKTPLFGVRRIEVASQEDEVWLECPTGIRQDLQRDDDEREAGEDTTFRGKLSIKVTWPQTAACDVKQEVFQIGGCSTVVDWGPWYITSNHSLRSRRCSFMSSRSSLISSRRRSETCRKFNVQIQNSTKQQTGNQREFIIRHPCITNVYEYEDIFIWGLRLHKTFTY